MQKRSNYLRLALHSFIMYSGFAIVNPHISILFQVKGFSSKIIGVFMSAYFVSGLIGPLFMARLVQNNQRYRLFFFFMPLGSLLFIYFLGNLEVWYLLLALCFCFGFLLHSFAPMSDATLMHVLDSPYRDYGTIRAIGTIGFISASILLTVFPIVDLDSATSIYLAIMIILLIIALVAFLIPPKEASSEIEHSVEELNFSSAVKTFPASFPILLVLLLANFIGLAAISVYLPLYIKLDFQLNNTTSIWILAASAELIGLFWGQRIIRRIGYFNTMLMVLGGTLARLLLLSFTQNLVLIYLSQMLHVFSFAFSLSAMVHFVNNHIAPRYKPVALGIQQSAIALARMIAAVFGGWALDNFGFNAMFLYSGGFVFAGLVVLCVFNKTIRFA